MTNQASKTLAQATIRRGISRWRWVTIIILWSIAILVWPVIAATALILGHPTYTSEGWLTPGGAADGALPFLVLTTFASVATVGLLWFVPSLVRGRKLSYVVGLLTLWIIVMLAVALVAFLLFSFVGFMIAYTLPR